MASRKTGDLSGFEAGLTRSVLLRQAFGPLSRSGHGLRLRCCDQDDRTLGLGLTASGDPGDPMWSVLFGVDLEGSRRHGPPP